MTRRMHINPAFVAAPLALILGATAPTGWADEDEIPFDEAFIFFELNHTDGDLGIHGKIDGGPWKRIKIEDPNERKIMNIRSRGRLARQGMTELFFESAEPTFEQLEAEDFFRRFPAGMYEIEGRSLEGEELESEVKLTHVMPAPAEVYVNDEPAAGSCDDSLPIVEHDEDVVLSWKPVTMSHPDPEGGGAGVQPPVPVNIINYEVVVEIDGTPWKTSTILSPGQNSFEVPEEILEMSEDEVKFEVLAREASYNQTAVESCFEVEDEDE